MNIAFVIAYEQSPYAGTVRPFINWAKALGGNSIVVTYKCSNALEAYIRNIANQSGFTVLSNNDIQKLSRELKQNHVDYLFSDDYMPRLILSSKIGKIIRSKHVVYAQILRGMHSISKSFYWELLDLRAKAIYSAISILPFKFVSHSYINLLKRTDVVIANSKFTSLMLSLLYGIEHAGVVYPPIDTNVFTPKEVEKDHIQVLIYLGSNAGDTNPKLVQRLVEILSKKSVKIHLLGNEIIYKKYIKQRDNLVYHKGLADEELAKIYSKANFTIAPQTLEFFGLVPVESLSCGTPVLTRYPHEALHEETVGQIAYNDKDLIAKAEQMLIEHNITDKKIRRKCREVAMRFSIERSTLDLLKILGM